MSHTPGRPRLAPVYVADTVGAVELDVDTWSAIGTGAAAVIAVIAAVLAAWQAHIARGARDATADQARIAGEALALQREQQHKADEPKYDLTIDVQTAHRPAALRIRMLEGPEVNVRVEWEIAFTWQMPGIANGTLEVAHSGIYAATLVQNATLALYDDERPARLIRALGRARIVSTEVDDERREWKRTQMANWILDTL